MPLTSARSTAFDEALEPARRWLSRARGQQAALSSRARALLRALDYQIQAGRDEATGEDVLRFFPTIAVPQDISYLAKDSAITLRRSLDAAYKAVCPSRLHLLPRSRRFPFVRSAAQLERRLRSKQRSVTTAVGSLIRNMEPYPEGDGWMAALPAMCRCPGNKLLEVQTRARLRVCGNGEPYAESAWIQAPAWQPLESAMELRLQDPAAQLRSRYRLSIHVGLRTPTAVAGHDVIQVLVYQTSQVEGLLDTLTKLHDESPRMLRSA